jgi:hypothetical protein
MLCQRCGVREATCIITSCGQGSECLELHLCGECDRAREEVVTDVVAGPNLRRRDNAFQALVIAVTTLLTAAIAAFACPKFPGFAALGGALAGLLTGLLLSGIFLMILHSVQHTRGKHR